MEIIDYAQHMMHLEKLVKEAHYLCLHKQYNEAGKLCHDMIAETRRLCMCLHYMDDQETKKIL